MTRQEFEGKWGIRINDPDICPAEFDRALTVALSGIRAAGYREGIEAAADVAERTNTLPVPDSCLELVVYYKHAIAAAIRALAERPANGEKKHGN